MRKLFLILVTLMLCSWSSVMSQNATYRCTVLDAANNEPLIGATISPIGCGRGIFVAANAKSKNTIKYDAKKVLFITKKLKK